MFKVRLSAVAVGVLAFSGCVSIKQTLPPEGRQVSGGRSQIVTVTQSEIIAGIQESNISAATGGGLLFALIDAGVNNARAKTAEAAIVPVRDALTDFQFEQRAMALSEALAERVTWLGVSKTELNKDPSNARLSKAIDDSAGPQLLSITYDYLLDNNFKIAKLGANVSLLQKAMPKNGKPEQRALLTNAAFARSFIFVMPLQGAKDELDQNAALWAKDGGQLAEASLNKALQKALIVVQKGLEHTVEQEKKVKAGKVQKFDNGFAGKVIETDADGTLLLNNFGQWIYVFRT